MAKKNSKKQQDKDDSECQTDGSSDNESLIEVDFTESLIFAIDGLLSPRPNIRKNNLSIIQKELRGNYFDLAEDWNYKETFLSGIEFCLKKGKSDEQVEALRSLGIFITQLSTMDIRLITERYEGFCKKYLGDSTQAGELRGAIAENFALLNFLSEPVDYHLVKDLLEILKTIFKDACLKGDGKPPDYPKSQVDLHVNCLYAWGLLFTLLTPTDADKFGQEVIKHLTSIIQSKYLNVRIAAGDVLAVVYERLRDMKEGFKGSYYESLTQALESLCNDCDKRISKADAKKQRSHFRDLLRFLRSHEGPSVEIKLPPETLDLVTYEKIFIYEAFCHILTHGMNTHLKENTLLRNIFEMGLPVQPVRLKVRARAQNKKLRNLENQMISKDRDQRVSNFRDKRVADFHDDS